MFHGLYSCSVSLPASLCWSIYVRQHFPGRSFKTLTSGTPVWIPPWQNRLCGNLFNEARYQTSSSPRQPEHSEQSILDSHSLVTKDGHVSLDTETAMLSQQEGREVCLPTCPERLIDTSGESLTSSLHLATLRIHLRWRDFLLDPRLAALPATSQTSSSRLAGRQNYQFNLRR